MGDVVVFRQTRKPRFRLARRKGREILTLTVVIPDDTSVEVDLSLEEARKLAGLLLQLAEMR